jgi:ectoine hydroxylase-related dioxygenase (phytanoyl-CoA dioxygenase family)
VNQVSRYGVVAPPSPSTTDDDETTKVMAEIRYRGFASLTGVLTRPEVERLNRLMDEIYARQCDEVGGEDSLLAMNDADIARCLLAYSEDYMRLALHPRLIALAKAMLGDNVVLLMQNGVINRPDRRQFQTSWHRDLNYQHWTSSRSLAISALVCLEDFSPETGGTTFLPGSHKFEHFPPDELVTRFETTPVLPAGSMILFDSMVFHRAGLNRSNRVRRAVNHVLGAPILAQQIDIPAMLQRPAPDDPWLAGYLGYKWNPKAGVSAWRNQRIAQAHSGAA